MVWLSIINEDTRKKINERFLLLDDPSYQDWPLEVSSGSHIEKYINSYEGEAWNTAERVALMQLILFSYEDYLLSEPQEDGIRSNLKVILLRDFDIHRQTIEYWCRFDLERDYPPELQMYPATLLAQEVWSEAIVE